MYKQRKFNSPPFELAIGRLLVVAHNDEVILHLDNQSEVRVREVPQIRTTSDKLITRKRVVRVEAYLSYSIPILVI